MGFSMKNVEIAKTTNKPLFVIEPQHKFHLGLKDLWIYRDLLIILAGRDVKLRYKQTILGIVWVILQPLVTSIIFTIIFGNFAGMPSDGTPYILFVFAGLLPWNLFSSSLSRAGGSLVSNAGLISKIYFPRLVVPIASVGAILIDFFVAFLVTLILMVYFGIPFTWRLAALPYFLLITLLTSMGVSLLISSLSVYYRDFIYALPFLIQAWTYASPVVYSLSIIPIQWRWLVSINPAIGFIEGFRWALLGSQGLTQDMFIISSVSSVLFFLIGLIVFRRVERGFADVI